MRRQLGSQLKPLQWKLKLLSKNPKQPRNLKNFNQSLLLRSWKNRFERQRLQFDRRLLLRPHCHQLFPNRRGV